MSVTTYTIGCGYDLSKLKNQVYFLNKDHQWTINIDNGEASVTFVNPSPYPPSTNKLDGFNIKLQETESLDERYKFTKNLTMSINGHLTDASWLMEGDYYLVVQTEDGTYYIINVDFPSKMTYRYNLSEGQNQTDFTFTSNSNYPTLKFNWSPSDYTTCKTYNVYGIDKLQLLEKDYTTISTEQKVINLFEGQEFKNIDFLKNTISLQESYDGNGVETTISFDIPFDGYKSSWQYNLLEFTKNLYAAHITPKNSVNEIWCGYEHGLQPSYQIDGSTSIGEDTKITITLVESSQWGISEGSGWTYNRDSSTQWIGIESEHICVGFGVGGYLLMQEVDKNGIPTGRYKCLDGYEDRYSHLNIIDTYDEAPTFNSSDCARSMTRRMNPNTFYTCIDGDKYAVTYYGISYDNNKTWTRDGEYQLGEMVESGSSFCEIEPQVKWVLDRNKWDCMLVDPDYRWVTIDPSLDYMCSGVSKHYKEMQQVSWDEGVTWEDTTNYRIGDIVDCVSNDCGWDGTIQTRWVTDENGFLCNGYDKYSRKQEEVKYGGDNTWKEISGSTQIINGLAERFSSDCCTLSSFTADTCSMFIRKANVTIETASLDGENWIETGQYTINRYLDEYNLDCINANCVKFLGIPTSGASGKSYFDYNYYMVENDFRGHDGFIRIPSGTILEGINDNYVIIGCESSSNTFICADDNKYGISGATNNIKYIFINDCAVNPIISKGTDNGKPKYNYDSLEKIFISSGASGSFGNVQGLQEYTDYNFAWENVSGSTALTEIVGLGDSKITQIGLGMFEGCTSLISVHLPSTCYFIDGYAFSGCTSLSSVTIDSKNLVDGYRNYNWLYGHFACCTSLRTVTFPNDYHGMIYRTMFGGCSSLSAVTLGNPSVIGDYAFDSCTSLSSITLGNAITSIGQDAFRGCSALTDVYLGNSGFVSVWNRTFPSGIRLHVPCESYGYWHDWYEIQHPDLGVTVIANDMDCAQYRWVNSGTTCSGASGYDKYNLEAQEFSTDSGSTWYTNGNVRVGSLIEENSLDCGYIPYKVIETLGDWSGYTECETSVTSQTITRDDIIDNGIYGQDYLRFDKCYFGSCGVPTTIGDGGSVIYYKNDVSPKVNFIMVGEGVTTLADNCFIDTYWLSTLILPSTLTSIGKYAITFVYGFDMTVKAITPPTVDDRFLNTEVISYYHQKIYVPAQSVETYKAASGWSQYAAIIEPIETINL